MTAFQPVIRKTLSKLLNITITTQHPFKWPSLHDYPGEPIPDR